MPPMKSIPAPDTDPQTEAIEAIRPSFDDLVELSDISLGAAAGTDMPEALVALARRAESVGWKLEDAKDAIRQLARERLGAEGPPTTEAGCPSHGDRQA